MKGLKEDCVDAIFGCFGGDLKRRMNIDPDEILRRLGGV